MLSAVRARGFPTLISGGMCQRNIVYSYDIVSTGVLCYVLKAAGALTLVAFVGRKATFLDCCLSTSRDGEGR